MRRHTAEPDLTDPDNPEVPSEAWAYAVRARSDRSEDILAAAAESKRRYRGAQKRPTKVSVTLRLERAAVAAYRATGRGWQSRLSDDVSAAAKRHRRRSATPDPENPPMTANERATLKPFPGDLPPAVADAIRTAQRTGRLTATPRRKSGRRARPR